MARRKALFWERRFYAARLLSAGECGLLAWLGNIWLSEAEKTPMSNRKPGICGKPLGLSAAEESVSQQHFEEMMASMCLCINKLKQGEILLHGLNCAYESAAKTHRIKNECMSHKENMSWGLQICRWHLKVRLSKFHLITLSSPLTRFPLRHAK